MSKIYQTISPAGNGLRIGVGVDHEGRTKVYLPGCYEPVCLSPGMAVEVDVCAVEAPVPLSLVVTRSAGRDAPATVMAAAPAPKTTHALIGGTVEINAEGIDFAMEYTFSLQGEDDREYGWSGIRPVARRAGTDRAVFLLPGLPVLGPGSRIWYTAPEGR